MALTLYTTTPFSTSLSVGGLSTAAALIGIQRLPDTTTKHSYVEKIPNLGCLLKSNDKQDWKTNNFLLLQGNGIFENEAKDRDKV